MRLPKVFLTKELKRHLRAGHPWVFSDAIRAPAHTPAGLVALCEPGPRAKFIAYGLYQPDSSLAFRVLSLDEASVPNEALLQERFNAALKLRQKFIDPETNAYRFIHGEGDLLPGLLCDLYNGVAVIKYDCAAASTFYDPTLLPFLEKELQVRAVYQRFYEREADAKGVLRFGDLPEGDVEIKEAGLRFGVDVRLGQKTGFFLDQRENRRIVRSLSLGKSVLNCFSYTGGFSVAAALGGAQKTTSVDISSPVIEAAKKNFLRNQLDPAAHKFISQDAFAFLRESKERYQLVILDPPSFAPNEKSKPKALAAYKELNSLGIKVLSAGGILCTASCSSHISEEELLSAVREAAIQERRPLRALMRRGAGPDHPVPLAFPEGNYLKFIVLV